MALTLFWAGCSFTPAAKEIETETTLPEAFTQSTAADSTLQYEWWKGFNDPALDRLVDSALVRNFDLQVAAARIDELQNQYRIARSELFPSIAVGVDRNDSSTPTNTGATGDIGESIPGFPDRFDTKVYNASLGFSWELDVWGRIRGQKNAALNEFFATQADFEAVRMGIISETIATYYEIAELERSLDLRRRAVDLLGERLELTRDRYQSGLLSSFELYSIEQTFQDNRSLVPILESALYDSRARLDILLGTYASDLDQAVFTEELGIRSLEPIPAGLPSDLLRQRPDVLAQAARLEAARQRIGVARAEQFPAISLTGAGGTTSSDLSDLLKADQLFFNLTSSIVAPLFNGGAIRANIGASWARYEQQAATYAKTVLTAFKEVESALVLYQKEQERYQVHLGELESATDNAISQERRFIRGVGDYLAYVDAVVNQIRVEVRVLEAQRSLANARLNVHRALGGAWVDDGEMDDMAGVIQANEKAENEQSR
jgi:multidrug efflux system outer membrane protein